MTDGYGEIKYRAQHGEGLALDKVRLGSKLVGLRLRDKRHAALEAILEEHGLVDTAAELEQGHRALVRGMGYTVQEVHRIRGASTNASEWLQALISDYLAWDSKCKEKYLSPIMCREVVIEGYSLNECDDRNKMRHGTAKKQMVDCLLLFAQMRRK